MIGNLPYPAAPLNNILESSDVSDFAGIFSHFRLVKGYTGPCRRVRRASDGATLDVGFTSGGLYNIKEELTWAAGSNTTVERIYNQNTAAYYIGPFLTVDGTITASTAGSAVMLAGYPAMSIASGAFAYSSNTVGAEETAAVVVIGSAPNDSKLFSISSEGEGFVSKVGGQSLDAGPFEWSSYDPLARSYYHTAAVPAALAPFLLALSYDTADFGSTANINGGSVTPFIDSEEVPTNPIGLLLGAAYIGGSGAMTCHTFIVDSGFVIHNKLRDAGNPRNWIY